MTLISKANAMKRKSTEKKRRRWKIWRDIKSLLIDRGMVMKPIALTLSKNMYEYLITNLHKNATLVFCT